MNRTYLLLISLLLISTVTSSPTKSRCANKKTKSEDYDYSINISGQKSNVDSFPSERADYLVEDILFLNPLSALDESASEENSDYVYEEDSDYLSDEDVMFADLNRHKLVLTEEEIQQDLKKKETVEFFKDC